MPRLASALFIVLLSIAVWSAVDRDSFQTDLFSILPELRDERLPDAALEAFSDKLSRRVVFLVSAGEPSASLRMADEIHEIAAAASLFESFEYRIEQTLLSSTYQALYPYRYGLLSQEDMAALQNEKGDFLVRRFIEGLVSPVSGHTSASLVSDPFQLYMRYLGSFATVNTHAEVIDGAVFFRDEQKQYLLISAVLAGGAFDQATQDRYAKFMAQLGQVKSKWPHAELLDNGLVKHALANRVTAQQEIALIGGGSLLAILLLFFLVFRRLAVVLYIALPVFVGMALALLAALLLFGQIHIITLVFGASLIGVSIDYTFHYCCAYSGISPYQDAHTALKSIRPSLTIGLLTSIIGYIALATTGFPALEQMAVFAVAGLFGAYIAVIYLLPAFIREKLHVNRLIAGYASALLRFVHRTPAQPAALLVVILLVGMVSFILLKSPADDVRDMRAQFAQLENDDARFMAVIGEAPNSQYFVVSAEHQDELLKRMDTLQQALGSQENGRDVSLSRWLPSVTQQQENRQVLRELLAQDTVTFGALVDSGLPADILLNYTRQLEGNHAAFLTPEEFLATDFGRKYKDLWLGEHAGRYHAIVMLSGQTDLGSLRKTADRLTGVVFVDRAGHVSRLFQLYRQAFEKIVPFILVIMVVLLALRYGFVTALRIVATPVIAALLTLVLILLVRGQYNIFNLFGLVVTVAVAIDYAVFIRESGKESAHVLLAILLSALTTAISLGLLALSNTPALTAFGVSLLLGVLFACLLTFVSIRPASMESGR